MSPTQVSAGLGLLKKVLPDLSSIEIEAEHSGKIIVEWRKDE